MNEEEKVPVTSEIMVVLSDYVTVYQNGVTKMVTTWERLPETCDVLGKQLLHTLADMKDRGMWRLTCKLERR